MESGPQSGQYLAANITNPWWSNGTSGQIPCYNSYQAYYPSYSSPWYPWMPGTCALPKYNIHNPVYYNITEEQPSQPAKRIRLQDDITVSRDYADILQPPQDQDNTVLVFPGLLSNTASDPLLYFSDNANCIPSAGLDDFEIVQEQLTVEQPAIGKSIVQPDSTKTPLQGLQQLQQDEQPITAIPSFKSISTVAGTDGPLRRRGRYGRKSLCIKCNKTFNSICLLKLHMFEHTGEKPFTCNICGRGFNKSRGLKKHLHVHFVGDFSCPLCSKTFHNPEARLFHVLAKACTSGHFHRHLRQTVKGWNCLLCDDWDFTTREQAVRHVYEHEQEKGMFCPVCNQHFHEENTNILIEHVKKQHRNYIPSLGL